MSWIDLVVAVIGLAMKIYSDIRAAQDAAAAAKQTFDLNQGKMLEFASQTVSKMRDEIGGENRQAGNVDDRIDQEMKK